MLAQVCQSHTRLRCSKDRLVFSLCNPLLLRLLQNGFKDSLEVYVFSVDFPHLDLPRCHQPDASYLVKGDLAAIRLVNLHGYVSCNAQSKNYWSYWGCGSYNADQTNVVITDDTNTVVLPPAQLILNSSKWAIIPGYNAVSPELVMSFFSPKTVKSGQQFRLWYGEDLMKHGEGDNGGRACIDVYALYV
ncbi:hypothetical protein ACROYT_G040348 [Oculina patagonica]